VKFPIFAKTDVNGENTHEVFKFLRYDSVFHNVITKRTEEVPWNFAKFLVDSEGKVVNYYDPQREPLELIP
jgi:glutathione peroxidase